MKLNQMSFPHLEELDLALGARRSPFYYVLKVSLECDACVVMQPSGRHMCPSLLCYPVVLHRALQGF